MPTEREASYRAAVFACEMSELHTNGLLANRLMAAARNQLEVERSDFVFARVRDALMVLKDRTGQHRGRRISITELLEIGAMNPLLRFAEADIEEPLA